MVKQRKIDVLLAQETHSVVTSWIGLAILSHNTTLSGGVAILFSHSFIPHSYTVEEVLKGRILKVRAHFENSVFIFICAFAPTSTLDRMCFWTHLVQLWRSAAVKNVCFWVVILIVQRKT